jgi:hypothetical protein
MGRYLSIYSFLLSLFLPLALPAFILKPFPEGNDSLPKFKKRSVKIKLIDGNFDFYTTLNGNRSINSQDENTKNNLYVYYNFTFQNRIKIKKIKITSYFFNEFGIRRFKDSIVSVAEDIYNFKNSISVPFKKSHFDFNLTVSTKSQFWNHYTYTLDSNKHYQKNIYTSYLSPGYIIYSGGIRYNFWNYSSIEIGLASGKTTKIKNQDIFTERKAEKLYGINKGTFKKTNIGFHILVNISAKKLFKNFYIEQFSQIFIDKDSIKKIKSYNVDVNNAFHYVFLKFIRLSVRTKFLYDQTVFIKPTIIQQISIGFYLNNKLQ